MTTEKVKVLVVDDSRIFRGHVERCLSEIDGVVCVGSVMSAAKASEYLAEHECDLVLIDSLMPDVDGFALARTILEASSKDRERSVLLMVDPSHASDSRVMDCLAHGVFEAVVRPIGTDVEIERALTRTLAPRVRSYLHRRVAGEAAAPRMVTSRVDLGLGKASLAVGAAGLNPVKPIQAEAVLIAASTGGPKALDDMLPALCRVVTLPILIVQHMPDGFTEPMAKRLTTRCGRPVVEGRVGDLIEAGRVYIAPGGRHLLVRRDERNACVLDVNEAPPYRGLRPAADLLFKSALTLWGGSLIAVVLTGMGDDGTEGARLLRQAGGHIIAQDEASSVVWGMPGSVVQAGIHHQVLPLTQIPDAIGRLTRG